MNDIKQKKNFNIILYLEQFIDRFKLPLAVSSAVLLLIFPHLLTNQYILTIVVKVGIYIILALGLNILTGYVGLVSLGHAGFVAIGAYTASLLATRLGLGFFLSMLCGMICAGIAGILLGLPTLRLSGTYLSIVTLGFGEIIKTIAMNWDSVTNGTLGVKNIPSPSIFGLKLTIANGGFYYLMLVMLLIVTLFCYVTYKSRTGRAFLAIKTDEMAGIMMGINVTYYKVLAFVLSACICASAGALYASLIGYIDPNTFTFDVSTMILSIVILGGMGTIRGMFIGSIILITFPELSRSLMDYRFVVYGLILVLMMRFRPQGLLGWKSQMPYKLSKSITRKLEQARSDKQENLSQ
ncbi:amino acid/amide ABC transporter membrane protein 2 (HAAT family) [Lachnotalea glycerini]|uniref:Amino acid/amide ABC transporter membrane protein 2 (HAAT family) n=1 Tax=Lachnotalea glycerini TaxID=1763509 RepID=A0A255I7R0_9FIRM|nr:branched-chain amino acid ABC transporter permease [Lachnotalea glycerini]PXV85930.1 amino acid/amide ABC transporter membrane protein 2 (HAAT family) [Lachnotalea glycerini]RDY29804.1 branched-chain amino acid ABC transporter permease [Lachnotalea glycerini]